jgi:hypothetical protein
VEIQGAISAVTNGPNIRLKPSLRKSVASGTLSTINARLTKRICLVPQRRLQSAIIYCGNAIIPTWSEGDPNLVRGELGMGDDGSGPYSLAGRMAPIVKRRALASLIKGPW